MAEKPRFGKKSPRAEINLNARSVSFRLLLAYFLTSVIRTGSFKLLAGTTIS
jgi:hypothetical protein